MSGVVRGMLLGAGGALGVASQTESLNDVPRTILKAAVNGYDRVSVGGKSSHQENSSNEELAEIMSQIKDLKVLSQSRSNDKQVIVYGNSSGTATIVKVVLISAAGVCVCYYFGFGFNDIMYVTKSTLNTAIEKVQNRIGVLGVKLDKTKEQLLSMISNVEDLIFSTSDEVKATLESRTDKINSDIQKLDTKFHRIQVTQEDIQASTEKLDSKIELLRKEFEANGEALEKANSGIRLLVNSVVDLPHVKDNGGLVDDLRNFLSSPRSWFSRSSSSTSTKKNTSETSQTPSKYLFPNSSSNGSRSGLIGLASSSSSSLKKDSKSSSQEN